MPFKSRYRFNSKRRIKPFRRFKFKQFRKRVWKAVASKAEKKCRLGVDLDRGVSDAGLLYNVNDIPLGTDEFQRVGSKIQGRFLKVRVEAFSNGIAERYVRFSIIRGRTAGLGTGDAPLANVTQMWDKDKWEVLHDRTITLAANGTTSNRNLQLMTKTVRFFRTSTYTTISSNPVTNPLYIFLWSNDAVDPLPTISITYQFSFNDI